MEQHEPIERMCAGLGEECNDLWWEYAQAIQEEFPPSRSRSRLIEISKDEVGNMMEDFASILLPKWEEAACLETLQREVGLLKARCAVLEQLSPILVPIESLAPEPYEVIKPFHAVVRFQESEYVASFFDANLSASGDTQVEAIANLKDIITATFDILITENEKELGPGPLQQKKVLREFMCAKD